MPTEINGNPKQVLFTIRIIWFAMLMGLVLFAGVMIWQTPNAGPDSHSTQLIYFYVACAMLTAIPIGLFVRGQVFKRGWEGDVIRPSAYAAGNIIAFACCEGPTFFALIMMHLDESIMPNILPAIAGFIMLVLLWPNGRAMFASASLEDRYPTT